MSLDARYWDREFETRPWAWIEAWQAQQLAMMLDTLPQRSELYRELLGAAGRRVGLRGYWVSRGRLPTLDMLETLPFTTAEQLRDAQESAPPGRPLGPQQAVPQQYIVQVVASPGGGAGPLFSGLTRRDQDVWSDAIANSLWTAGIRPEDVVAHLADLPALAAGWPYADGLRRLGATVAWLGGWPADRVLALLPALHVTALVTTSSTAVHLADVRQLVADGWGATHVRDTMGLAEVMAGMWSECCYAGGMHFNAAKYVIVELVDPATGARVPWSEGARGEAVYTTFDRDATPVLRYRSADLVEVTATRCPCGRTSPRVRRAGAGAGSPPGRPETALVAVGPAAQPNGGARPSGPETTGRRAGLLQS